MKKFIIDVIRWCKFYKVIRKSFDFDFTSQLYVELHQLIALRNCINKFKSHEGSEIDIMHMDWAINCLYIVLNGIPFKENYKFKPNILSVLKKTTTWYTICPYVNTRNASRFIDPSCLGSNSTNTFVLQELRDRKAWALYNKIRQNYLLTWWD